MAFKSLMVCFDGSSSVWAYEKLLGRSSGEAFGKQAGQSGVSKFLRRRGSTKAEGFATYSFAIGWYDQVAQAGGDWRVHSHARQGGTQPLTQTRPPPLTVQPRDSWPGHQSLPPDYPTAPFG